VLAKNRRNPSHQTGPGDLAGDELGNLMRAGTGSADRKGGLMDGHKKGGSQTRPKNRSDSGALKLEFHRNTGAAGAHTSDSVVEAFVGQR
jgi:hypothetical protein